MKHFLSYFVCGIKLIKQENLNLHFFFTLQVKYTYFINIKTVFFCIQDVGFPTRQYGSIFLPFEN